MNEKIIDNFLSLCAIPHKSHHEEKISRFLYDWAVSKKLEAVRDEEGNVIIDKPGTPGHENAPRTILQAHMDMVVVWEDGMTFDPLNDHITVINDGKTLKAKGTSLGGDDGAGVALAMSILEDETAVHGPIRAIFTVDEEDGMSGADNLAPKHLDAQYLINLDWEEFRSLCNSSAGSDMYRIHRAAEWEPASGKAFAINVSGLVGGHSGASIHLRLANAIRMAARTAKAALDVCPDVRLAAFRGGSAHNAIPASCSALITVPEAAAEKVLEALNTRALTEMVACAATDPNAKVAVTAAGLPEKTLSGEVTRTYLTLLTEVFDGVHTMSPSIPSLVESSANTGLASVGEDEVEFMVHQRSSEPAITAEMKAEYERQAAENGFTLSVHSSSPAWPLKPGSELVEICKRIYKEQNGKDISVEPVHAGLECGSFASANPALDIISIGPDILDIHSPRETLVLDTVYRCDALVRAILKEIAEKQA